MGKVNVVRTDEWSANEDIQLTNLVLSYIKKGATIISAFEEYANQSNGKRTKIAVAYRWNSKLGKRNRDAIAKAKATYRLNKKQAQAVSFEAESKTEVKSTENEAAPIINEGPIEFAFEPEFVAVQNVEDRIGGFIGDVVLMMGQHSAMEQELKQMEIKLKEYEEKNAALEKENAELKGLDGEQMQIIKDSIAKISQLLS